MVPVMRTATDLTGASGGLDDLVDFFSELPVGLVEIHLDGRIERINQTAVDVLAMLAGDLPPSAAVARLLRRHAPALAAWLGAPVGAAPVVSLQLATGGGDLEVRATSLGRDRALLTLVASTQGQHRASHEHDVARRLHAATLGPLAQVRGLAASVTYRPSDVIGGAGGDWYDLIELPGLRTALVIGDVVGHGLPASITMGRLRAAIKAMAPWTADPAELLERLDGVAEQLDGAEASTVAYAILDRRTGRLSYSTAGHPPLLVVRHNRSEYLTGGRGAPLACPSNARRSNGYDTLAPGDTVVLHTNGLTRRPGESPSTGLDRLLEEASRCGDVGAAAVSDRLSTTLLGGRRLEDDVCVLAVRYLALPGGGDPVVVDIGGVAAYGADGFGAADARSHGGGDASRAAHPAGSRGAERTPPADMAQRLLDHVPAMAAYWGADERNVSANRAYVDWFGVEPEELVGCHLREILGEDIYAMNLPYVRGALAGCEQRFERTMVDVRGRVRRTHATYVPDRVDGVTVGFFALVTDITPVEDLPPLPAGPPPAPIAIPAGERRVVQVAAAAIAHLLRGDRAAALVTVEEISLDPFDVLNAGTKLCIVISEAVAVINATTSTGALSALPPVPALLLPDVPASLDDAVAYLVAVIGQDPPAASECLSRFDAVDAAINAMFAVAASLFVSLAGPEDPAEIATLVAGKLAYGADAWGDWADTKD